MSSLIHSSELQESIYLMRELLGEAAAGEERKFVHVVSPVSMVPGAGETPQPIFTGQDEQDIGVAAVMDAPERTAPTTQTVTAGPPEESDSIYRGDRLETCLHGLCHRGGLSGAMIADDNGFAVASYNSPVENDIFAALASVLGGTLDKAVFFLGQQDANNISMDVNYADKVVVRKFTVAESPFYLIIVCPQNIDERSEVELSIDQIKSILAVDTIYSDFSEDEQEE